MIKINKKEECMGCYACAEICPVDCISMAVDSEGFWYPLVDEQVCIECGRCIEVCPIIQKSSDMAQVKEKSKAYAALNVDESVRMSSSSGGIFTLLAETVLSQDGVVFGARFDNRFNVIHDYVETKDKLELFRGSKYTQSKIGHAYSQAKGFLEKGRLVLFSGTPCQISGLKHYLGKEYDNLICQDIVCHGVPSPKVWGRYVTYRENYADSSAKRISFRQKDNGWKRYSVSFLFDNDTEYVQILKKDLYMRAFLKNICLRPSCYDCQFKGLNRESDITLADFWGIQYVLPEMDDDKGTSLVMVHSTKGQKLLDEIDQFLIKEEVDVLEGAKYNSAMIKSVGKHPKREEFYERLDNEEIDKLIKTLCRDKFSVRVKRQVKASIRFVLVKLGLLDLVKRILRGNQMAG